MITAFATWLDSLFSTKVVKVTTTTTRYYQRQQPPAQKGSRVVYDTDPTRVNAPCDRPSAK